MIDTTDQCEFRTTKPKGALSQSARRGSAIRYERCKNRATDKIVFADPNLHVPGRMREARCCALHKRLHLERGWLP